MTRAIVVLGLLSCLAGCARPKALKFPPQYVMAVSANGGSLVTMPDGTSVMTMVHDLSCGVDRVCKIGDLGRMFYVTIGNQHAVVQDVLKTSDLTILVGCGETYLCLIDQKASLVTILKKKP